MKLKLEKYLVKPEGKVKLKHFNPEDHGTFNNDAVGEEAAKELLVKQKEQLADLQNLLYADGSQSLLVILQAMDAGGKDSTIRHVFGGMNPQGVRVTSFKAPSSEDLSYDYLWRIHQHTPAKGMIGVFNRSHYEDVLVVRVKNFVPKKVWSKRYEQINCFEEVLTEAGTKIIKIFLNISKEEQKKRFEERLSKSNKHWKFNSADLSDRELWDDYQKAFEDVFNQCSVASAPWYIIPANNKWYRNVVIAQLLIDSLESMKLSYPSINYDPSAMLIPD